MRSLHLSYWHCQRIWSLFFVFLLFFFFRGIAQKTLFSLFLLFYLNCHMVRHPLPPILSQLRHPWPLLMLLVDTHGKGVFQRWYSTYCPRQLVQEGRTAKRHRQQGHCQWKPFVDQSSWPGLPLPGHSIPTGLHCHRQSLSTSRLQLTPDRNPLCSFSSSLLPRIFLLYIKETVAILPMF